jgi:hypothetical protein
MLVKTRREITNMCTSSSVTEVGLTIFTASLAALRPLLKLVPWGKTNASYGPSSAFNKKSQGSRQNMGPSIKLADVHCSKASTSQEYIVPKDDYKVGATEV